MFIVNELDNLVVTVNSVYTGINGIYERELLYTCDLGKT